MSKISKVKDALISVDKGEDGDDNVIPLVMMTMIIVVIMDQ